jgi:L-rhamnonate dehydratase
MKIAQVQAHYLDNIPIQPPPFRKVPNVEHALLVEITTDQGLTGWSIAGYSHPVLVDFINHYVAPVLVGENALLPEQVNLKLQRSFTERHLGRTFNGALATIDIALWDIKGKALGLPVHELLGGARDRVPVYITHGAAYGGAPVYSTEELAAEAKHLVELGNVYLKNTVGRQAIPDPRDDYERMKAMRDAVGPSIKLAMDGNSRMTASQAIELCARTEELDISFLEEPCLENDVGLLSELRKNTRIPIAAGENHKFSALDLLRGGAVDIIQPNVNNDAGYTGGLRTAALARAFNAPLGHGNGNGPHNIALHAGVANGGIVEYHFHKWMAYNAIFKEVPQPKLGFLYPSQTPGVGLDPKDGLIAEYKVRR